MPTLEAVLLSERLERYLGNFVEVGITSPNDLVHLTLDDYHTLGIDDLADRKRLYQLIQRVKAGDITDFSLQQQQLQQQQQQPPQVQQQQSGVGGRGNSMRTSMGGRGASGGAASAPPPAAAASTGLPRPSPSIPTSTMGGRQSTLPRPLAAGGAQPAAPPSSGIPAAKGKRGTLTSPHVPAAQLQQQQQQQMMLMQQQQAQMQPASAVDNFLALSKDLFKIRVAVKLRPLNAKELKKKEIEAMEMPTPHTLVVTEQKVKVDLTKYTELHNFNFDECIGADAPHEEVYHRTVRPLVAAIFNQAKTTCFAYGQTGSGKTYTMAPMPEMAARDILTTLRSRQFAHLTVWVSVFEIYLSSVFDLLSDRKRLVIREDSGGQVHIVGLEEIQMTDTGILAQLLATADKCRSSAPTHANANSSRSHQVLQIRLKDGDQPYGKMSFIDLAGSEWGQDIKDTNRQTRMEGAEINKSLLALKECIRALDRDAGHVPFRGSKLTEVLKDSFTGNSFTIMIACSSPASGSVEHSLNTLRYADRVKELQQPRDKNKPYVDVLTPGNLPNQRQAGGGDRPTNIPAATSLLPAPSALPQYNRQAQQQQLSAQPLTADEQHLRATWERTKSTSFVNRDEFMRDLVAETAQDEVLRMHDELIDVILAEEEQLMTDHRTEIEDTMHLVKEEMKLLDMMDNPGTQVDDYVSQLDVVLQRKIAVINDLRNKLKIFQDHLVEESQMATRFTSHSYSRFY